MAATLLIGAMLAMFAMLDAAAGRTVDTSRKEAATALAREVLEDARALPFWQITPTALPPALQALPPLRDTSAASGWTVVRRDTEYTLSVTTCAVDDPQDGTGVHDAGFCPGGAAAGGADLTPIDTRRISVDVRWTVEGRRQVVGLTGVVAPSALTDAPDVRSLAITSPGPSPITGSATQVAFAVRTSGTPARVTWAVDGSGQGEASGAGQDWTFWWPIADLPDGTYAVSATALDAHGSQGASATSTVVLNRNIPGAVGGVNAGRNGAVVEVEWLASPERDVAGYHVYRGPSTGSATRVCSQTQAITCVDTAPPAPLTTPLYYWVVPLDRDTAGALREGARSTPVDVNTGNRAPTPAPAAVAARRADGTVTITWTASPGDPDVGDGVGSYRIYRDGLAIANRIGRTSSGTDLLFVDAAPGAGTHTYAVTAVDTHLAESVAVPAVSP